MDTLTSTQSAAAKCHSREGFYTSNVISRKPRLGKAAEDRHLSSTTRLRNTVLDQERTMVLTINATV